MPMTPAGWRLVPVEPTDKITDAGSSCGGVPIHPAVWAAMVAAAPDPLQDERLIETIAQAICDRRHHGEPTWKYLASHQCENYCREARAVLALFRGEGK